MYLVSDYWVDRGNLDYTTGIGAPRQPAPEVPFRVAES
jgi:hypothetical protein